MNALARIVEIGMNSNDQVIPVLVLVGNQDNYVPDYGGYIVISTEGELFVTPGTITVIHFVNTVI